MVGNRQRAGGRAALASAVAWWGGTALVVAGAVAGGPVPAARAAVPAASSWGKAIGVPGLRALEKGGFGAVNSVSCASTGNCTVGGDYFDPKREQGFVADERHGRWGKAIAVPGLATLNKDGIARVISVSCASAGNCAAGGAYEPRGAPGGFVVIERHGRWGKAIAVPGLAKLAKGGGDAEVNSVSCGSAGNCAAGGGYSTPHSGEGFLAVERDGRWAKAIGVPGLAALNKDGDAEVNSVSCGSAGNCAAGGSYTDRADNDQAFVALERHGRWETAIEVPGLAALNKGLAQVNSVSCTPDGGCAATGTYYGSGVIQVFVADERHGSWSKAIEVPGLAALNKGGLADVNSMSCASAGNCAVGGGYLDSSRATQGFVADERHGSWAKAIELPGLAALSKGGLADVNSMSCPSAGNCAVGGSYTASNRSVQGFVAVERHGRWSTAIEVPGLGALNKRGHAVVNSVSCPPTGGCAAAGSYDGNAHTRTQGFVAS